MNNPKIKYKNMDFLQKTKEMYGFFDKTENIVKCLLWLFMVVSFYFNLNSIIDFSAKFTKLPPTFSVPIGVLVTFLLIKGINTIAKDFINEFGKLGVRFYTLSALLLLLAVFLFSNSWNGGAVLAEGKVKYTLLSEVPAEIIKNQIQEETKKYNGLISKEDSILSSLKNSWLTAKQREQILLNKATYIKEKSQRLTALEAQYAQELNYIRAENDRREKQFKEQVKTANEQGGTTGGIAELAVFICTAILIGLRIKDKKAPPTLAETEESESVNLHENITDFHNENVKIDHTPKYMELSNAEFQKVYGKLFPLFEGGMNTYNIRLRTGLHANTIDKIRGNWEQRGLSEENYEYLYKEGNLNGMKWTNPNTNNNDIKQRNT